LSYFNNHICPAVFATALAISPSLVYAADDDERGHDLDIVKPYVDARYRLEAVDQDGKSRDAAASTVRVKVSIVTKEVKDISIKIEGQAIINIGVEKFNGWAAKFLATPAGGLRDLYADVSVKVPDPSQPKGLVLKAIYHDFNSTGGNLNYDHEWDFLVSQKFWLTTQVKL